MANSKHTSGPWEVGPFGSVVARGSVDTVSGSVLISVAHVEPTVQMDSEGRIATVDGSREANASLIAAAPDLLERAYASRDEMSRAADLLEHHGHRELAERLRREADYQRAAIAKAEGR